jgi:hypothetical protein
MQEAVQSHLDMKHVTESMTGFSDCRGCRKHVCPCRHFGGYEETRNPRGVTYVFKEDFYSPSFEGGQQQRVRGVAEGNIVVIELYSQI